MGQDKANLILDEKTLLQRVTLIVQPLFHDLIVSVREPRANCALLQVCDPPAHAGPLAGLAAGLSKAETPWVFAIACDMPFITPTLIEHLAVFRKGYDAVVPVVQGYPQPLAAFYSTRSLNKLHRILENRGKHSLRALLDTLHVRYVYESELLTADPRIFFDLDTPEDIARLIDGLPPAPLNEPTLR
jgi:molybdopterin-guanine dinucleotide biosynthesis protein A